MNTTQLSEQAVALAEQLGRIAGTIEGTAERWLNRQAIARQLTAVRDGATELLNGLAGGVVKGRELGKGAPKRASARKTTPAKRAGAGSDLSRAPGKRHRKPAPTVRGAKKSDERIPKMKTAETVRQRRKSYA
jgi:hypothetical protein